MKYTTGLLSIFFFFCASVYAQELIERRISPSGQIFDIERKGTTLYVGGLIDMAGYLTGGLTYLPQADTMPDLVFPWVDGSIHTIIPDGEGGWFVGGDFDRIGIVIRNNIARILPDFTVDPNFTLEVNNKVTSLALHSNILYIGGNFTNIGGVGRNYLGSYDLSSNTVTSFNPGPNLFVNDLIIHGDDLYITGFFSTVGGSTYRALASIDLTSGLPQTFPEAGIGQGNTLFIHNDILYVGGNFAGYVKAIDLNTETETGWSPGLSGLFGVRVNDIIVEDTIVYLAGSFTKAMGQDRVNLAAVSLNGNLMDTPYDLDAEAFSLVSHNGDVYVGGDFTTVNGLDLPFIAKLNSGGDPDPNWNLGTDWAITAMLSNGNDLIVGGEFEMLHHKVRDNVFALDLLSGEILDWAPESNFLTVMDIELDAQKDVVYLVGWDSQTLQNIKGFNGTDGTPVPGWNPVFDDFVYSIDQDPVTGILYAGGNFSTAAGQPRNKIAAFDTDGSLLPFSLEPDSEVRLVVASNEHNTLYFAGDFEMVGDSVRNKVAATDFNGNILSWDPQLSYDVPMSVAVNGIIPDGNRIFLGGFFATIKGEERLRMGAVDPVTAEVLDWNPVVTTPSPANGTVNKMIEFRDGILLAGDNILEIENQPFNGITLVGKDNGLPLFQTPYFGFGPGNIQIILAMAAYDSVVYVGGAFEVLEDLYHPHFSGIIFPEQSTVNTNAWPVTENFSVDLRVYPNPFADQITLQSEWITGAETIEIHDMQGRRIYTASTDSSAGAMKLDLGNLVPGIYIIELHSKGKSLRARAVKY